jgi:hypothetical protein
MAGAALRNAGARAAAGTGENEYPFMPGNEFFKRIEKSHEA